MWAEIFIWHWHPKFSMAIFSTSPASHTRFFNLNTGNNNKKKFKETIIVHDIKSHDSFQADRLEGSKPT